MQRLGSADDGSVGGGEGVADELPDEDTFVMPAAWRRVVHPRRGGVIGTVKPVDHDAVKVVESYLVASEGSFRRAIAHPASDPHVVEALQEFQDGQPNPLGAAAAAAIAGYQRSTPLAPFADAWASLHGLVFAARAIVEFCDPPMYDEDSKGTYILRRNPDSASGRLFEERGRDISDRIRELLAVADDDTYQAAVSALAKERKPGREGVVAAYILPTEQAWVDEYCASLKPVTNYDTTLVAMLYCSMNSPEQAARLGWHPVGGYTGLPLDLVATMADGIGPEIAPLLALELGRKYKLADPVKSCANALVELPTDLAFAVLVDHAPDKYVQPGLRAAARRYPVRATRTLARVVVSRSSEAAVAKSLLVQHIAVHRAAAVAAMPTLSGPVAALVKELLASVVETTSDADTSTLPAILVNPPWNAERPAGRSKAPAETPAAAELALPKRLPVIGDWAESGGLPQIPVRTGGALPAESVKNLIMLLALSGPRAPFPGVDDAKAVCDPAGLARWAWALFEQWRLAGHPAKDVWALHALGLLGNDDTALRLTPVIRAWPGEGGHQRAVTGLEVLATIGTNTALLQLHGISQRVPFKALKARAQVKIAALAKTLGLTAEQLGDRLVPDFGLDADGTTVIDYGPRTFTVGFDEQLRPFVLDEDGKQRKDLPAPGARDDADLAPAARKQYMDLKKSVRSVAALQLRRLEDAMVTQRTWSLDEFRTLFIDHPLIWHVARRLLWTAEIDGAVTAFRVAEDRTFADVDDSAVSLSDDTVIRLAHPIRLGTDLAAWSELFADYEILQPFNQLGRATFELTDEERASNRLARFEGIRIETVRMLGLVPRGWERGTPLDNGVERWLSRNLGPGRYVVLEPEYGLAVGMVTAVGENQNIDRVWLAEGPGDYRSNLEYPLRFADLDPVTASEVLADLTWLTTA